MIQNTLNFLDRVIDHLAIKAITISLIVMILLTMLNIVLRFTGHTLVWIEPCVRHLVFLSAFLGGILATGRQNHISIDLFSKVLLKKGYHTLSYILQILVTWCSTLVSLGLAYAGYRLMLVELDAGTLQFFAIQTGYLIAIIPLGFLLISFRFGVILYSLLFDRHSIISKG